MPRKRRKLYPYSQASLSTNPDDLLVDTTGEERFHIFQVCTRMCKYTAALLLASAALSTFMILQYYFIGVQTLGEPQMKLISIIVISLIGIINLVCGVLLLATE